MEVSTQSARPRRDAPSTPSNPGVDAVGQLNRKPPVRTSRGEQTRGRILAATIELLGARPIEAISLNEVCIAADVSASSLYHLFPAKTDLVRAVHQQLIDESLAIAEERLGELAATQLPLRELVVGLLEQLVELYQRVFSTIYSLEWAERDDASLARARTQAGIEVVDRIAVELARRVPDRDPNEVAQRARFASRVSAAMIGRYLLAGHIFEGSDVESEAALISQLSDMAVAYILSDDLRP